MRDRLAFAAPASLRFITGIHTHKPKPSEDHRPSRLYSQRRRRKRQPTPSKLIKRLTCSPVPEFLSISLTDDGRKKKLGLKCHCPQSSSWDYHQAIPTAPSFTPSLPRTSVSKCTSLHSRLVKWKFTIRPRHLHTTVVFAQNVYRAEALGLPVLLGLDWPVCYPSLGTEYRRKSQFLCCTIPPVSPALPPTHQVLGRFRCYTKQASMHDANPIFSRTWRDVWTRAELTTNCPYPGPGVEEESR